MHLETIFFTEQTDAKMSYNKLQFSFFVTQTHLQLIA